MKKKLTIDDVTKEDWIIMRLLCQIMRERNESKRWYLDNDVCKTLIYIGTKYPDLVLAQAVMLLREERKP